MSVVRRFEVKASRWPWQDGGKWNSRTGMCRFGGGWHYKLGIQTGGFKPHGCTLLFDLLWGSVEFIYRTKKGVADQIKWNAEREEKRKQWDARAQAGSSF